MRWIIQEIWFADGSSHKTTLSCHHGLGEAIEALVAEVKAAEARRGQTAEWYGGYKAGFAETADHHASEFRLIDG